VVILPRDAKRYRQGPAFTAGFVTRHSLEGDMVATLVLFQDTERRYTSEQLREIFEDSAPHYRGMDGLRSKVYVIDEERGEFGGFYLWESREQMERVQGSAEWLAAVSARYGLTPTIRVFAAPVTIDKAVPIGAPP